MVSVAVLGIALVPVLGASIATGRQTGFTRAEALAHVRVVSMLETLAAAPDEDPARAGLAVKQAAGAEPVVVVADRSSQRQVTDDVRVVEAVLDWRQPGEAVKTARAFRLTGAPDHSWTINIPLPQKPADSTPAD
jgi:hypothetical protein